MKASVGRIGSLFPRGVTIPSTKGSTPQTTPTSQCVSYTKQNGFLADIRSTLASGGLLGAPGLPLFEEAPQASGMPLVSRHTACLSACLRIFYPLAQLLSQLQPGV